MQYHEIHGHELVALCRRLQDPGRRGRVDWALLAVFAGSTLVAALAALGAADLILWALGR